MSRIRSERLIAPENPPRRARQTAVRQSFAFGSLVFAATVFLRAIVLARLSASPFLLPRAGDMHFYNDWAQRILHGSSDKLAFYGLPGYAYLLAGLYKIFGYNPLIAGICQALLDGGTALLIYRISLSIFAKQQDLKIAGSSMGDPSGPLNGHIVGAFAALGWAFVVPAQAYSVILMPTAWLLFIFWLVVWQVVRKETAPTRTDCLLLGLVVGITATIIATILFLVPLAIAAVLLKRRTERDKSPVTCIAIMLTAVVVGTAPCWIHNYFVAHDRVILSAHSGINFWIGNNPDANGYPRFPPGMHAGQAAMLDDSIRSAEAVAGRPLKRSEVSAYWSNRASGYIAQHPIAWFRLLLLKLRNVANAFQYDDLSVVTMLGESGIIVPGLHFGLIAALAVPGILLACRVSLGARWVASAILLHVCALIPVFVTERYRLAIVPGLLIFAAAGLHIFWRSLVRNQYTTIVLYVCLVVASTLFVSWPQKDPALWALDAYNSGWQALEAGDLLRSERKLLVARAYVPTNPEINFALGNLRLAEGRNDLAVPLYLETLGFEQNHSGALNNLGVLALEHQKYGEAEAWFRRLTESDDRNAKAHFLLAKTLLARGDKEKAEAEIDVAIHLRPEQAEFRQLRTDIEAASR